MVTMELFGEPWVLFRDAQGLAACVKDACAHRACPLSLVRASARPEITLLKGHSRVTEGMQDCIWGGKMAYSCRFKGGTAGPNHKVWVASIRGRSEVRREASEQSRVQPAVMEALAAG